MRWAAIAMLAGPVALVAGFLFAQCAGNNEVAQTFLRIFRYLLAAEILLLAILILTGQQYERRERDRDSKLYPPPGKLVDIGGYRLHLNCAGDVGPSVVLEYGHQGSYLDWRLVQPDLARWTRVCSYDRAGYGWSDSSPTSRVPSVMAQELHTLLRTAGEKPPYILVGHSFGALNAIMFAHLFPEEVAGVVLVDGSHPDALEPFRLSNRIFIRTMQFTMPLGLPRYRRWCGGAGPETIRGMSLAISCRSRLYGAIHREWAEFPRTAAEIRAINNLGAVPLIVIARDPKVRGNSPEEIRWNDLQHKYLGLSTNSEFVIAAGSGHNVPLADPTAVVDAVRKLARNSH